VSDAILLSLYERQKVYLAKMEGCRRDVLARTNHFERNTKHAQILTRNLDLPVHGFTPTQLELHLSLQPFHSLDHGHQLAAQLIQKPDIFPIRRASEVVIHFAAILALFYATFESSR
jgi:hypothetical protein